MMLYIIVFLFSFYFIARSSAWLVHSLIGISRLLGLSEYSAAFLLMSFAASIPELFVGVSSALSGVPALSFGNILGANLINILVILGLAALFAERGLTVDSKISRRNFLFISAAAFLPIFLALDGTISRGDGLVLLFAFAAYIFRVAGEKEYFIRIVNSAKEHHFKFWFSKTLKNIFFFSLGAGVLLVSSGFIVWSAKGLSALLAIKIFSFGVVFVAIGTALPEVVFGFRAMSLRHSSMTVGTALGAVAFTSTFVVAITSLFYPIPVEPNLEFAVISLFLFLALVLFNSFVYSRSKISRREGFLLLAIYAAFVIMETIL